MPGKSPVNIHFIITIFAKKKMAEVGKVNKLKIKEVVRHGLLLEDNEGAELLLPSRYVTEVMKPGDSIDVFVYRDSEDRLVAVTDLPLAFAGELAFLEVKQTGPVGAFLDWGLPKDLLVPFSEQKERMITGRRYLVYVYVDPVTNRMLATSRLNKFIENDNPEIQEGSEKELIIEKQSELGYHVIIENRYRGILYKNEVFTELHPGDRINGYIKTIRPDGKIDCTLHAPGLNRAEMLADKIVNELRKSNGYLPLGDHTEPEEISRLFSESKKTFKKAIGLLFRKKLILIEESGIRLV